MKTILSGFILLGLWGCGDLSSAGKTVESQSEQTDKQGKKSIIGRTTREILNANEALKDLNYVIVKLDVQANDPVTQAFQVYEKAAPFLGTLGIKQWVEIEKALNDRPPTYAELQAWMEKNPGVKLPVLPYKRMYGYDETKGEMVVLEKRDEQ